MLDFLGRIFGRDEGSKKAAKDRLRFVLVHDRTELSSRQLQSMKEDLIQVISKYFEIEDDGVEVNFDREEKTMALVASIPIRKLRRGAEVNANS